MALRSVVYKVELQVADMDRGYYGDHALTLARHPSETEERMMVRLLAWALNATDGLAFGRGLSTEDEPDLCLRDATGAIAHWIDVGLPDERLVRKACGRAERVTVYVYGGNRAHAWWQQNREALARLANLTVVGLDPQACAGLASLAQRSMRLNCTVQEGLVWMGSEAHSVSIEPEVLKAAGH